MTNRDKYILKKNECDVLCGVQLALLYGEHCIISALTAKDKACPAYNDDEITKYEKCCRCIQKWLNEDA